MDPILTRAVESGSPEDLKAVSDWWASGLHTRRIDSAVARQLVERGATLSVHAAAGLGFTDRPTADQLALALGGAAKGGHLQLCRTLLARGADVNGVVGRDLMTPLLLALKGSSAAGSSETVAELLQRGADVGARNRFGSFALHLAASCGANLDTIRLLLRSGAGAHAHAENQFGYTPLRAASETGHEDVAALLREVDTPPTA